MEVERQAVEDLVSLLPVMPHSTDDCFCFDFVSTSTHAEVSATRMAFLAWIHSPLPLEDLEDKQHNATGDSHLQAQQMKPSPNNTQEP